ncbi:hypothetical protein AYI68_g3615 [Smittium mucronatum]|uniref:Uncharacterized protein n=1 Tax=Smittium mucronatum TaxID=133383 RepID=A0A1R0GZG4_9FUNG|nr:hypothetical protein AYI68_g3615 [Smittium mucronatum]
MGSGNNFNMIPPSFSDGKQTVPNRRPFGLCSQPALVVCGLEIEEKSANWGLLFIFRYCSQISSGSSRILGDSIPPNFFT